MKTTSVILTAILMIVSFLIIFISLLLAPDSNSFSGALVGSGDLDLFKVSKWSMYSLGILLFIFSIALRISLQKG